MSRPPADTSTRSSSATQPVIDGSRAQEGDTAPRRTGSLCADTSVSAHKAAHRPSPVARGSESTRHGKHPDSPENHDARRSDLLKTVASESSVSSVASPVFSSSGTMPFPDHSAPLHALTPLTSSDFSPPGKLPSPQSAKPAHDIMHATSTPHHAPLAASLKNTTHSMTPVHTPPESRISIWPTDGERAKRIVYDPYLDPKARSKAHHKPPKYITIMMDKGDPSPPDPRLAIAGYTEGKYTIRTAVKDGPSPKTKLRMAPKVLRPYKFQADISCGPGPATQVVITGFDPLTPETTIRFFCSAYGEVESVHRRIHPVTGSPLGICLVKFRDGPVTRGGRATTASESAKLAEEKGSGQRLGEHTVNIVRDREGLRCERLVNMKVNQGRKQEERQKAALAAKPAQQATPARFDLPANVPKGPSGRGARPPPREHLSRKAQMQHLVEERPIKAQLKRTPYLFIAHQYVPVMGTTIEHLKKRMKAFHWTAVRCDISGYFVIFEDSKRGEVEAVRCFKEFNMGALFNYVMNIECCQYGDPDYERSPSPERVREQQKQQAERDRVEKERQEDYEYEKMRKAETLDPVQAVKDAVAEELLEKAIADVKLRIVAATLSKLMDPSRQVHRAKRQKYNIPDPQSKEDRFQPHSMLLPGTESSGLTPKSQAAGFSGRNRKTLGGYGQNRVRNGKKMQKPINAFVDERRRAPPKRPTNNLYRTMLDRETQESDDEGRSSVHRGTEEQDSRPISRAETSDIDDDDEDEEDTARSRRFKRRRTEAGWGLEDSDEEIMDDSHARSLLAHCIHKDPEQMAEKELEQVLAILPRSSPIWKNAYKSLRGFKRLRRSNRKQTPSFGLKENSVVPEPQVVLTKGDEDAAPLVQTTELAEPAKAPPKKKQVATKAKRKTKKQLEEEGLKEAQVSVTEIVEPVEEAVDLDKVKEDVPEPIIEETPEEEERGDVYWGVSAIEPRRTVEDGFSVVMDIDGWQHLLKDAEDLVFLKAALGPLVPSKIGDAQSWAWKQKSIKHLNRPGEEGVSRTETRIEGYYVPNSAGSARTEGIKKIRESEKSKYLPHRIRVQKQREERQRRAKQEERTTTVVEGFKFLTGSGSKPSTTSNSRATRANNRRLVNDISISKNMTGAEGDALRFNQLKKRKKLVKFDRSAIHNWGLYAQESIAANDMIIEYVGEKVRQRVADLREAKYDMQGVGSSYLFRIDEDTVIDATKMGGIARFINHSCTPNCTAKIIRVEGTKRIVIYALRDIRQDEELTYDYKFERELDATDRIPCLCGSVGCKGFLN